MTRREWIDRFAQALGTAAPDDAAVDEVLLLASAAARGSERSAAPVACWMAAAAGRDPAEALALAEGLGAGA